MKKVSSDKKRFRRTGGTFLFIDSDGKRKRIKTGQLFFANPNDLSESQLVRCICLDDSNYKDGIQSKKVPLKKGQKVPRRKTASTKEKLEDLTTIPEEHKYELKHKGGSWYDIVDSNEKKVNNKSLRKTDAEDMLKSLTKV